MTKASYREAEFLKSHCKDFKVKIVFVCQVSITFSCMRVGSLHRETYRDALLEFTVSTENLSVCLRL